MKKGILPSFAALILLAIIIPGCDPPRGPGLDMTLPGTYKVHGVYAVDTATGAPVPFYILTDSFKADIIIVNKDFTYHQTRPDTSVPFIPPFATDGKINFSTVPADIDGHRVLIDVWDASSGLKYKYFTTYRGKPGYFAVELSKQ